MRGSRGQASTTRPQYPFAAGCRLSDRQVQPEFCIAGTKEVRGIETIERAVCANAEYSVWKASQVAPKCVPPRVCATED